MSNKLETKLSEYAKTPAYPFHMPGHKRIMNPMECSSAKNHSPGIYSLDITEIDGFDNLHDPQDILKAEMERAANLWGARKTWFSVNGSTCAILAAISAVMMLACGNGTPKASLKSDIDTVSYAIGMAQTQGLKDYLVGRLGVDTAYMDAFIKGLNEGANAGDDKKRAAYFAGIQIGQQISNQMVKGINHELFGEDSTKTISLKNFMAGFVAGTIGKGGLMTVDSAAQMAQDMMRAIKAKNLEKEFGPNKEAGEKYLADNAKKEGVKVLPSGVQYKVLKEGTGALPKDTSLVKVHYEGKTIDGKVFDSSYSRNQPADFRANQVIKGWTDALVHMPAGSVWEVYIPQELAYGERQQGADIKPFSMLIFKIELLEVDGKK